MLLVEEKNMTEITQNPHEIPLTEEMIPRVTQENDLWKPVIEVVNQRGDSEPINVLVDGHPATCCQGDFGTHSTRLQLLFNPPHPKWGEGFVTKYYRFVEPGKLELRTGETVAICKLVPEQEG